MKDIHIAGTGIWYPEDTISNDEIVLSFNSYVDNFNTNNKDRIDRGEIEKLEYSSTEFIEKASGIKTRHVIDKKNILDINTMMPRVVHEDESRLSIHAKAGIDAAKKAMDQAHAWGSLGHCDRIRALEKLEIVSYYVSRAGPSRSRLKAPKRPNPRYARAVEGTIHPCER